jgi:hypothetical protein
MLAKSDIQRRLTFLGIAAPTKTHRYPNHQKIGQRSLRDFSPMLVYRPAPLGSDIAGDCARETGRFPGVETADQVRDVAEAGTPQNTGGD